MKTKFLLFTTIVLATMSCKTTALKEESVPDNFQFLIEQFADLKIMRYPVIGFDDLKLKEKELIYYLSQAAVEGRDILFDQNYKYNLAVRRTLEEIHENYQGDRSTADFKAFDVYLKRIWFSNGIHHHYSSDKINPGFSVDYFKTLLANVDASKLPLANGESKEAFIAKIEPVIFDKLVDSKGVNQADGQDLIATSAENYYGEGVTQKEVEAFYAAKKVPGDLEPISYGLNSTLVKEDGKLVEKVWKVGGKYSPAIEKIVFWLEKALTVAENKQQKTVISNLIEYYKTGDLKTFDKYNIAWLADQKSRIDFVNGFTETYGDPLGIKASWESLVNFKNIEATKRTEIISDNAQWFEDNSPVDPKFKKEKVKGVTAKVITAAMLGGDCYPATPIGINLPNADWIRKEHGSKSVTIENITYAYNKAAEGNGFLEEFSLAPGELGLEKEYGFLVDNLHTDMHECLGHGSGKLMPGVSGDELKAYGAVIEEARADLFALYYMGDPKMVELGLLPDMEAYKASYNDYIRNGLMTQLTRIELGNDIQQTHMRCRQMIARWAFSKFIVNFVVERKMENNKTYFFIRDYEKLRAMFGELLTEIQRIKSEGDYEAAKNLVETFGIKVMPDIHAEVLERFKKLNLAPYGGFVNPVYKVETNDKGKITNVTLDYSEGYTEQMMRYGKEHSWLATYN
jgi:dipeptidyl-peptidase-3